MRRLALLPLLLTACGHTPTELADRAYVVGGAWVVILSDDRVCFQQDLYRPPEMDAAEEAIAACRARLNP